MDPSTVFCLGFVCFFSFAFVWFFCDSWGCFHGDEPQPAFLMSPWSLKTIDSRNVRTSVTWSLHCTSVPFTFLKNYKRSLGGLSFVCLFVCFISCVCVRVCGAGFIRFLQSQFLLLPSFLYHSVCFINVCHSRQCYLVCC